MCFFSFKDCIEEEWSNIDLASYGLSTYSTRTKDECILRCKQDRACKFWTWGVYPTDGNTYCWLKSSDLGRRTGQYTSGKVCVNNGMYI